MISELKDDEILEFLMTSEFENDYSPTELKYLLVKWRYFYRLKQGNLERKTVDFEGQIQNLQDQVKGYEKEKLNLQIQLADKQNIIDSMKNRNLTLKERWSGKIILKENEN
jgi:hypothetical protein